MSNTDTMEAHASTAVVEQEKNKNDDVVMKDDPDSDEEEEVNLAEIKLLNEKISNSPYNYQAHVDRIALLRKCGEFENLSSARHKMKDLFPLTKQLWLEWLEDEQKFAESEDDHQKLESLFELAVQDYLSCEIWLEYIQYSIRYIGTSDGVKKLRNLAERALSSVGLHVLKGSSVWEAYREIESAVLATIQPQPGSITTPEQNDQIIQQTAKVGLLFTRQLAVPLLNMESTMVEYEEWWKDNGDGEIPESVLHSYDKALEQMEELKIMELALESAESPKTEEYNAYIDHEMKSNNPARIQCIYERAITDNCLNAQLWMDYLKYLTNTLKSGPIVLSAYKRSVRNCPWVAKLWVGLVLTLERNSEPQNKVEEGLNEALAVGFSSASEYLELWRCWCDYIRRTHEENPQEGMTVVRTEFKRATSHLLNEVLPGFSENADHDYTMWIYWANIEARGSQGIDEARKIMEEVMKHPDARLNWKIWEQYYHLERLHGDLTHARNVLRHAVQSSAADDGSAESACEFLIRFERENGSLSDLDESIKKVEGRMSKVIKRREKLVAFAEERQKKQGGKKFDKNKKPRHSPNKKENRQATKRNISNTEPQENIKRKRTHSPNKEGFKEPAGLPPRFVKAKSPEKTIAPPPGYKPDKQQGQENEAPTPMSEDQPAQATITSDERTAEGDKHTVFISNMSYSVQSPEEKLKIMFGCCGDVKSVRVVRDHKGKMRGFGFVTFHQIEDVEKALNLDRQPLEGRPLYVSRNTEKSNRQKVFKYETKIEKHKLFVSGLNFATTEETLQKVFSEHGVVKSARIVVTKGGKSKGIAFIEYENESDAAQAVMKMDETEMDGFTIKVAISNPPPRGRSSTMGKSLGQVERGTTVGSRGKGKSQVTLIPRSLQSSKVTKPDTIGKQEKDANDNTIHSKGLSNRDFAGLYSNP
uniref:squamous cell carcinoma antigen recognized by T-cells 3 n=1 Tax=Ciona intestinalis TaxID=7719 RepID=UPI0000522C09|nr:squamous cell carcinoma antigen recognized by T-cells 3 [Ciona intestinalis]|eukprot:XP_002121273.1 squamous cell carcinoma antigen recognized by T-cells 3 [Ciona intestinalis]